MRKIITVVGARPQFIKAAAVSRVLRQHFHEVLVDTGQHYDYQMAGVFFEELEIPRPEYHLAVGSGSHGRQTGTMMIKLEEVILEEVPDAVMVYGDTNSTLAGALVASKLHIPLFHVEAGLRSYNKKMPEEINRLLTDHLSTLLFVPTDTAIQNLKKEGITQGVSQVGDVMYDAVLHYWAVAASNCRLQDFQVESKQYYLATIHRAENTDNPELLRAIIRSLLELDCPVLFPVHPRTRKQLESIGLLDQIQRSSTVRLVDPVSYLEMLFLEKHAKAIITDSGGVQKEAYFAKVPCFTLRNETEWVETVDIGWNRLIHPEEDLSERIKNMDELPPYVEGLYGDGRAAEKISQEIQKWFEGQGEV